MFIQVAVDTGRAKKSFYLEGPTLTECFGKIPLKAASLGLGLLNDGSKVTYTIRIEEEE